MTMKKVAGLAARYVAHRGERDSNDKEMKKLAPDLKEYAEALGEKTENGSFKLPLSNGLTVSKISVKKDTIDEAKAIEVLTAAGLLKRCSKTVIDKAEIERCLEEGLLGVDDIAEFNTPKETFRLDVRAK